MSHQIAIPRERVAISPSPSMFASQQHHHPAIQLPKTQVIENQRNIIKPIDSLQATKRAKIELDNGLNSFILNLIFSVQIMVKRIKEDFNSYFLINEKFRKSILQKVLVCPMISHRFIEGEINDLCDEDRRMLPSPWSSWCSNFSSSTSITRTRRRWRKSQQPHPKLNFRAISSVL
jgi:hypothetical protein